MGFAVAALSAAQTPCQPFGSGHLFPFAHSGTCSLYRQHSALLSL